MKVQMKQFAEIIEPIMTQKALGHITFEKFNEMIDFEAEQFEKSIKKIYNISPIDVKYISDVTNQPWEKTVKLDITGTHEEYLERVRWFMQQAPDSYLEELERDFPGVNVEDQLNNLYKWLKSEPQKRRTQINGWIRKCLQKNQNRANYRNSTQKYGIIYDE